MHGDRGTSPVAGISLAHEISFWGVDRYVRDVVWSPDGTALAAGFQDGFVRVWEVSLWTLRWERQADGGLVHGLCWSPDGRCLAVPAWGRIVDAATGADLRALRNKGSAAGGASWSGAPSGLAMALGNGRRVEVEGGGSWELDAERTTWNVAWAPNGRRLATSSGTVLSWEPGPPVKCPQLGATGNVVAWSRDGETVVGNDRSTILLWSARNGRVIRALEGHTEVVLSAAVSSDGRLLASMSSDSLRLWRMSDGGLLGTVDTRSNQSSPAGLEFHPRRPDLLAASAASGAKIRVFRLDLAQLGGAAPRSVHYTTARIALVGDTMVGKSHLGGRIATGEWRPVPSTHGQEFWVVEDLGATRGDGVECEAVLWDFAGQPDYRIVHSLFLEDIDVALLLFDPAERREPLKGIEYWRRQLASARLKRPHRQILVGTKIERGEVGMTPTDLMAYCKLHGIDGGYVPTSALTGEGIDMLKARIRELIAWDQRPATVTSETFKRIKDFTLRLKEAAPGESVILSPEELRARLEDDSPDVFTDDEMMTAVGHLSDHGYVVILVTSVGERRILLAADLLANLAASLVLAARRDPQRHGSLEEDRLLAGGYDLPELQGLREPERRILLDATLALFLRRNVCFRTSDDQRTVLVFPSLINELPPRPIDDVAVHDDVSYALAGSVENIYAALVVLLGYAGLFTRVDQWKDQARFRLGPDEVCGLRALHTHEGELELVLYFAVVTPPPTRRLFESLTERLLSQRRGITAVRYPAVDCPSCNVRQSRQRVRQRMDAGKSFLSCDHCDHDTVPLAARAAALTPSAAEDERLAVGEVRAALRTEYEAVLGHVKSVANGLRAEAVPRTCFISHAWDDMGTSAWVEELAIDLRNAGVLPVLDRWHGGLGQDLTEFTERARSSDYLLVVGTPVLLQKYEKGDTVVGAEMRIAGERCRAGREARQGVIPVLRAGEQETALPTFLRGQIGLDFRADELYFVRLLELVACLLGVPGDHPGLVEHRRRLELISGGRVTSTSHTAIPFRRARGEPRDPA